MFKQLSSLPFLLELNFYRISRLTVHWDFDPIELARCYVNFQHRTAGYDLSGYSS